MNYREAIERIRARFNKWALDDKDLDAIKTLVPELCESDDERIRREIIKYLINAVNGIKQEIPRTNEFHAWIDYLIRQEEQAPEVPDTKAFQEVVKEDRRLEREGQESTEWIYPYGRNETVDKLVAIAECLEMDGDCIFNGYSGTECGKFLRDLARKQVECKPAEWSEEDEEMCQNILECLRNGWRKLPTDILKYESWLRSPHPNWKPSEEQMEALRCAVNDSIMKYDYNASQLKEEVTRTYSENLQSLLNDLSRL